MRQAKGRVCDYPASDARKRPERSRFPVKDRPQWARAEKLSELSPSARRGALLEWRPFRAFIGSSLSPSAKCWLTRKSCVN